MNRNVQKPPSPAIPIRFRFFLFRRDSVAAQDFSALAHATCRISRTSLVTPIVFPFSTQPTTLLYPGPAYLEAQHHMSSLPNESFSNRSFSIKLYVPYASSHFGPVCSLSDRLPNHKTAARLPAPNRAPANAKTLFLGGICAQCDVDVLSSTRYLNPSVPMTPFGSASRMTCSALNVEGSKRSG